MNVKNFLWGVIVSLAAIAAAVTDAGAQWVCVSHGLPEPDIHRVLVDAQDPGIMFAVSSKNVYRSGDHGDSWKQIFTAYGERGSVQYIHADLNKPGSIYVATDSGVWWSADSGLSWKVFYKGIGAQTNNVLSLAQDPASPKKLWLGTLKGLIIADTETGQVKKSAGFPNVSVRFIMTDPMSNTNSHIFASDGLYESVDAGVHWRKMAQVSLASNEGGNAVGQQLEMEEMPFGIASANIIHQPELGKYFAASPSGIYESSDKRLSWHRFSGQNTASLKVNYLARSTKTFYAATNRGVFEWDPVSGIFRDMSEGLPSKIVHMIFYEKESASIFAATKKGIYRWRLMEVLGQKAQPTGPMLTAQEPMPQEQAKLVLNLFETEPSIVEIQNAAVEYAEVHPRKIKEWRASASKKAWLPTLYLSQSMGRDENIDLDRGGTGDPDKFIQGPAERNCDWSVNASWNLGEILWNNDQTSIDTRSKLMVELRNDVLNEVTHLYFERRRLEAEIALRPASNVAIQIEKQLRLDELTAVIDGFTGGYLSNRINKKKSLNPPKP